MTSYTLNGNQLWHRVRTVKPLNNHTLLLKFDDSEHRTIDMRKFFAFPVFRGIGQDEKLFRMVFIKGRTIEWPDGATLDPDVLYHESEPFFKLNKSIKVTPKTPRTRTKKLQEARYQSK